ncbi:hypothetical protein EVAR_37261_1 [Eumeta japonica]|uniref:Uncharacterized protein n=1 Tax=Eumeta variegata TaxID=151549 RepID=A0A4C1WMR0_EUMVA|nr:hypothetical protein EVAR_37261_1 [Eumeta japonica]
MLTSKVMLAKWYYGFGVQLPVGATYLNVEEHSPKMTLAWVPNNGSDQRNHKKSKKKSFSRTLCDVRRPPYNRKPCGRRKAELMSNNCEISNLNNAGCAPFGARGPSRRNER